VVGCLHLQPRARDPVAGGAPPPAIRWLRKHKMLEDTKQTLLDHPPPAFGHSLASALCVQVLVGVLISLPYYSHWNGIRLKLLSFRCWIGVFVLCTTVCLLCWWYPPTTLFKKALRAAKHCDARLARSLSSAHHSAPWPPKRRAGRCIRRASSLTCLSTGL
jgi:hypothetical protein